jgi:tRNA nucleotidyltransferase (CCA-adding enzyme)
MRAETVIATHGSTDFDAFAAMLAARLLYPGAVVALAGSLNRNVREFARLHADELGAVDASRLETDAIRRLIVVETVHAARLGELEQVALDPAVEKVVFDHHGDDAPDWAGEHVVVSEDGALTTTFVSILAERELQVSPLEATAFALGIHEDTGSLTYPTATRRDAEALAWCLRHGAYQTELAHYLHLPLEENERELLAALIDAVERRETDGVELLVAAVEWPRYVDGVSNLVHKLADLMDAAALAAFVEMAGRTFCVLRSRDTALDASVLAEALGGGGHAEASSAIFKGPLGEALAAFERALPAAVRAAPTGEQLMSSPARSVEPGDTVAHAMVTCQRYGQSGILVCDGDSLVGSVLREDLDRAIGHGLSHAPVKGIMSERVVTAAPGTTLPELQRLLASSADGRVAIERDGRVVGIVTRGDVLEALGERREEPEEPGPSLLEELRALPLADVFEAVAAVAEGYDGVYLVGGTVRDILLGERSFDVDIAVEGGAIAFAASLATALGGRATPHTKFGTAVVSYGDGGRVDVVTARTEFYDAPAALPTIEHATIREDLFRRDFTINAMAVSLKGDDLGRLVDPFGGRRDLESRTIRVLHNLSFIDDPTRIFRAIRYENRLGFRMDAHTERLARSTIEMGLVGDLSTSRLRDELEALLSEGDVSHSILRLAELGADKAIHPHLEGGLETAKLFARLVALSHEVGADLPAWRLGLAALARNLPPDEVYAWLDRMKVRRRDAERIAAAVTVGPRIVERLREDADPADVVALAEPYAPDAPLYALALERLEPLERYFSDLRRVRLEIGGAELADLGLAESPRVGEVLGELRRRKLNGELPSREAELAAARELVGSVRP